MGDVQSASQNYLQLPAVTLACCVRLQHVAGGWHAGKQHIMPPNGCTQALAAYAMRKSAAWHCNLQCKIQSTYAPARCPLLLAGVQTMCASDAQALEYKNPSHWQWY